MSEIPFQRVNHVDQGHPNGPCRLPKMRCNVAISRLMILPLRVGPSEPMFMVRQVGMICPHNKRLEEGVKGNSNLLHEMRMNESIPSRVSIKGGEITSL